MEVDVENVVKGTVNNSVGFIGTTVISSVTVVDTVVVVGSVAVVVVAGTVTVVVQSLWSSIL